MPFQRSPRAGRHDPPGADGSGILSLSELAVGLFALLLPYPGSAQSPPGVKPAALDLVIAGDAAEYYFNRVAAITLTSDSGIVVLQSDQAEVVEFTRDGRFIRKWGAKGSGPGEFRAPVQMGWYRDSLWVFDMALARVSVFGPDRSFARSIPLTVSGTGYLLGDGTIGVMPVLAYAVGRRRGPPMLVRRFTDSGRILDTLLDIPAVYRVLEYTRQGGTVVGKQPFEDGPLLQLTSRGLVVVDRAADDTKRQFRVTMIDVAGDTVYHHAYAYRPVPVGGKLIDEAVRAIIGEGPADPEPDLPAKVRSALYTPATLPTVTAVLIGEDGSLWLRREHTGTTVARWTVLDAAGAVAYETALPVRFSPKVATQTSVWGIEPDSDGVPNIVRYRVQH